MLTNLNFHDIVFHIDKHRYEKRDDMNNSEIAKVFKAFCDERRIEILQLLLSGEKCACKLLEELEISQSTLSHHMRILCDSGVVVGRKDGKWTYYSINEEGSEKAKELLNCITNTVDNNHSSKHCIQCK